MTRKLKVGLIGIALVILVVLSQGTVFAQGCSVQMSMDPTPPFTLGTHVQLHVWGNCGTVRFEINGQPRAEIGTTEQWETWKTEEFGSGNFEVCGVGRGDGGWGNASRSCRTVYVDGGQAPPPGSQPGQNVRCWVNNFTVTPGSAQVGHTFQLAGSGQCDGNARAMRFTIDGSPFSEYGGNTHGTGWNSSGYSTGSHRMCVQITGGGWDQSAESCTNITLNSAGNPSNDTSQGPQTSNNQPGQTNQSGPGNQNNPPPAQNNNQQSQNPSNNSSSSNNSNNGGDTGYGTNSSDPTFSQPCVPSRLRVGDIAIISTRNEYVRLRSSARVDASTLTTIPARALITMIGGPVCSHAWQWYETQYGGHTGWVAEIGPEGQQNILRNGESLPNQSGSSSSSGGNNSSSSSSCNNAVQVNLSVGGRGRVTPGDPNRLRSGAGTGYSQIGTIPGNGEFQVVGGPRCADGYQWWQVTFNGQTGWTVAGGNGQAWVISLGGGSSNSNPNPPNNQDGGSSSSSIITLDFYYQPFNTTYRFQVDTSDKWGCVIVNGSSIFAQEINRERGWIRERLQGNPVNLGVDLWLYLQSNGHIDTFRVAVDTLLLADLGCRHSYYQIDHVTTDLSGLGNVMYGYITSWLPRNEVHQVADYLQSRKADTQGQSDPADDYWQIELGRGVANGTGLFSQVTASQVETSIPAGFVSST